MLNYNGELLAFEDVKISANNRAFKYGDSVFETVKVLNGKVVFWEDHYFRLMASMRMIRMKIPIEFTLEFLEQEILKTAQTIDSQKPLRARLSIFRKDGGLYKPTSNEVDYLIEVDEINSVEKSTYRVDLYKDFYLYSGHLSTIKSNNKLLQTLASVYADENDLDNCILLNERKGVVETINSNIFLIKGDTIKTPPLTEGCLKGVIRKKVIEILSENKEYSIEESAITPFEIQKADEVFMTNSITGIQSITHYRKKEFATEITQKIKASLKLKEITGK
ncbi:aminotransferase class IV [Pseudotenacibaculum haliotis]|uniref:branched-chain-amino-acid transaminase n=1 Tax=Pseudotenacibaculum haliotis TaxID=1862138 RepID=A0ABW5LU92_9FLAO